MTAKKGVLYYQKALNFNGFSAFSTVSTVHSPKGNTM